MIRTLTAGVAAAALFTTPLSAQPDWKKLHPPTTPPAITGHGMAYDIANDVTVLFGGSVGGSARIDETWLFDGSDWTQATPATSPPPRAGHPLAYDVIRSRVVLFGGIGVGTGALQDTWEWNGTDWTQMSPVTVPPRRLSHPLVYHPARGTCVMHGGNGLPGTLTDTWEWDGVDWTQIVTANAPSPLRFAADMAFDPVGGGLVLFGGYNNAVAQADTWYLDNATVDWTLLPTATTPPGRWDHTMTTDPIRNRIVMFDGGSGATADTWEFDGNDWNAMSPAHAPEDREDQYAIYDLVRGQVMIYGGSLRNDTWVYKTPPQPGFAAAIPYGEGCIDEASASVYETFPPGTVDLSNSTLQFIPTTNFEGYAVLYQAGAPQWFTPTSGNLGLLDEQVSAAQPLGFTLSYPGGSTNDVYISSNGFVLGQPGGTPQCCNGTAAGLINGLPRWSALWNDLNPAAGGTVHFDIDPVTQDAIVTFDQVPEFGQATTNTFQVVFTTAGNVEMRFQACQINTGTTLTGWSPGGGVGDPGAVDLSAITAPVITSPDKIALRHCSDLRPVTGNAVALRTEPIPASLQFVVTVFGLIESTNGIDLTAIGAPGCFQYVSTDAVLFTPPAAGAATAVLNVPNDPNLAGVEIKTQGAMLAPGYNALGVVTSNAVRLTIDVN